MKLKFLYKHERGYQFKFLLKTNCSQMKKKTFPHLSIYPFYYFLIKFTINLNYCVFFFHDKLNFFLTLKFCCSQNVLPTEADNFHYNVNYSRPQQTNLNQLLWAAAANTKYNTEKEDTKFAADDSFRTLQRPNLNSAIFVFARSFFASTAMTSTTGICF